MKKKFSIMGTVFAVVLYAAIVLVLYLQESLQRKTAISSYTFHYDGVIAVAAILPLILFVLAGLFAAYISARKTVSKITLLVEIFTVAVPAILMLGVLYIYIRAWYWGTAQLSEFTYMLIAQHDVISAIGAVILSAWIVSAVRSLLAGRPAAVPEVTAITPERAPEKREEFDFQKSFGYEEKPEWEDYRK